MQSLAQSASLSQALLTNTNLLLRRHGLMSAAVFEEAVPLKSWANSPAQLNQYCFMYASCTCWEGLRLARCVKGTQALQYKVMNLSKFGSLQVVQNINTFSFSATELLEHLEYK